MIVSDDDDKEDLVEAGLELGLGEVGAKSFDDVVLVILSHLQNALQLGHSPLVAPSLTSSKGVPKLLHQSRRRVRVDPNLGFLHGRHRRFLHVDIDIYR